MVKWMPSLPRRDTKVRSMITFGGNVAASYLIINVNRSAGSALVGWHSGAGPLGLYSRAYNLLMLPVRQLSAPVGSVVIPAFSRLQDSPERFARHYLRAIGLIAWIGTPIFGFLFVAAEPVITLVLGTKWEEAAPVFKLLVISALGHLLFESAVWLFISRGQSRRLLKLLLIISPLNICSFAIGLPFGIKGVALSSSLMLIGMLPWIMSFSFRGTCLTLRGLGRALLHPVLLCLFGISLAMFAQHLFKPVGTLMELFVLALGFASAYLFAALIPAVRNEVASFRDLLSAFKPSGQT
jgi:PST family polysaccharide transporter